MAENICNDPFYNIIGAITDLENQGADKVCIETLKRVQHQIHDLQTVVELVNRGSRMAMPPDLVVALDKMSLTRDNGEEK